MSDKAKLLKRLQICDFVLEETILYLDTHPNDKVALDYFKKHQLLQKQTNEEYTQKYGSLTAVGSIVDTRWSWVDSPWPWERDSEV